MGQAHEDSWDTALEMADAQMKALYSFTKNIALFFVVATVLMAFMVVWWFAAVFHGLNYLFGAKR